MVSLSIFITGNCHSIVKRIPYQRGSNPEKTFREENRNSDTRVYHIAKHLCKMMLDSKNLELSGCYHQERMSYPALLSWCEKQAALFAPYICDTGSYLEAALKNGKNVVLEAQNR